MASDRSNRINVLLDHDHATKLHRIAEASYVQPGTLARSLLSTALDQIDPAAASLTALLDAIPGALERAQLGVNDAAAGRVVPLEEL